MKDNLSQCKLVPGYFIMEKKTGFTELLKKSLY
ncbi:hypothetical protein JOC34_002150 [Virgibacillus halotolerans]|nr:hypothetical protein [Virgibacillus halotolerans]